MNQSSLKRIKQESPRNTRHGNQQFRSTPIVTPELFPSSLIQRKPACACGGSCPMCQSGLAIQAKLKIGAPNDKYEQEADRVAEQVMRMPDPSLQKYPAEERPVAQQITPLAQRQITDAEEEEEPVQVKKQFGGQPVMRKSLEHQIQSLRGGGRPLSRLERAFFEPRFGRDFSYVRLHATKNGARVAQAINARAFTFVRDVIFGAGEYSPGSSSASKLLAHELTHVVQQNGWGNVGSKRVQPQFLNKSIYPFFNRSTESSEIHSQIQLKSEKWEQVKEVGPLNAIRAKRDAVRAIYAALKSGLPGQKNGPADAFRHAYWNCLMVKSIGYSDAESVARIHEKYGKNHPNEKEMDDYNNLRGRQAGNKKRGGSCIKRVWKLIKNGDLKVIPNYAVANKSGGKIPPKKPVLYKPGKMPAKPTGISEKNYY